MIEFVNDVLTAAHMMSFALGIGVAIFLEVVVLPQFSRQITAEGYGLLHKGHMLVKLALSGLWITGIAILLLKISLLGGGFSAKLWMKFTVVGLLTLNMKVIETWVMPAIKAQIGGALGDFSNAQLRLFGAAGGLSAAGWLCALGLGAIGFFKPLPAQDLILMFLPVMLCAPIIGASVATFLGSQSRTSST